MNCHYHPDRDVVGMCVSCGKPICAECKVVLGEKFYCNPCADKLFAGTRVSPEDKEPNWFQRHLNWTAVLSWLVVYPIVFVAALILGIIIYLNDPNASEESVILFGYLLGFVVTLAWLLPTNGWILKQKGRRLWNLLWLFVPFGIWIFLSLENKNDGTKAAGVKWLVAGPVTIGVIGILAAVIIPNVGRFIGRGDTEAAATELANVQSAVVAMMVGNRLSQLPVGDYATIATSDMGLFPDPSAYNGTKHVLYNYGGNPSINYVVTQYTKGTYTVDSQGTVTQVTAGY